MKLIGLALKDGKVVKFSHGIVAHKMTIDGDVYDTITGTISE